MLQVITQNAGSSMHVIILECAINLRPNISAAPLGRTVIRCPVTETNRVRGPDQSGALHVLQPHLIMCSEHKLCMREVLFEKCAYLSSVSGVYGHQHIVEHGKGKVGTLQSLH